MPEVPRVLTRWIMAQDQIEPPRRQQVKDSPLHIASVKRPLLGSIVQVRHLAHGAQLLQASEEPGGPVTITGPAQGNDIAIPLRMAKNCAAGPERFVIWMGDDHRNGFAHFLVCRAHIWINEDNQKCS